MTKRKWIVLWMILLITVSLFLPIGLSLWKHAVDNRCVQSSRGLVDVTTCEFKQSTGISLDGDWQFHWKQFLNSDNPVDKEQTDERQQDFTFVTVPSQWHNGFFMNTTYPVFGYATYRTEVLLPEQLVGQPMALRVNSARVASRLFVDGQLIAQSGQPGTSRITESPKNKPYSGTFKPSQSRITIDVEVSNYHHGNSAGLNLSVILGSEQQLDLVTLRKYAVDWFTISFLLCIALFFLVRWLMDIKMYAEVSFVILLLSLACYLLTQSQKWIYNLFPMMEYDTFVRFAGISGWMTYMSIFYIAYFLHPTFFRKWMVRTATILTLLFVMMTELMDVSMYTSISGLLTSFVGLIVDSFAIWVFYRSFRQGNPRAVFLLIAISFWFVYLFHWIFSLLLKLNPHDLPPFHVPIFVLLLAVGLSAEQKALTKQLYDTELAMLRHQIKPHFLFNAMNTIIWASKRDPEQSRELLLKLSDFLRGSFDFDGRNSLVPFHRELELTEAYVAIETARFEDKLNVKMMIADEVLEAHVLVPPLIFQPLVENAVRHGVMRKENGGTVIVRAHLESSYLVLSIEDDGIGFQESQLRAIHNGHFEQLTEDRIGVGLNNVQFRLWKLYKVSLNISNNVHGGATVQCKIPYK